MRRLFGFSNDFRSTDKQEGLRKSIQRLKCRAEDIRGEVRNEELQARKKQRSEVSLWLEEVDNIEEKLQIIEIDIEKGGHSGVKEKLDRMEETVQNLVKQSEFPRGIMLDDFNPNGLELVTEKLEGSTPSDVQDKVWGCFERGEVRVGLYGMGGVGKTSVAMHINNKILRERDMIFYRVFYVTVSRDTNVYKLQSDIAKAFEIRKLKYEDEPKRAAELRQELTKREGSLLILDDVWDNISMAAVGVCVEGDGCKLLITTRRRDVCRKMKCVPVKIDPLSAEESWELFKKQLENYGELTGEVQDIARLVATECDGLPLGIVTMAGCMRGERSEHVWRDALRTLQDPRSSQHDPDMEDKVFKMLRFSYDRLNDENHRKCFLYCALYPEDHKIEREELIRQFIAEGLLDGSTRQEKIDRGHTLLNTLENASLLECVKNWQCKRFVKMHDLVRDMAIKIIGSTGLVKGGNSLKEVPGELQCINDQNLEWVSLMHNHIEEIVDMTGPNCRNVSVVLLQENRPLKFISESFFTPMICLNVLNLSRTNIELLPDSVSDLVNLKALLLSHCERLYYIPPIGKLTKLRELVLEGCVDLTELPEGMEELVSLELLNIYAIGIDITLSGWLISKLHSLESFSSDYYITVEPNELFSLQNLARLSEVLFSDANLGNQFVDLGRLNRLKTYSVCVGSYSDFMAELHEDKGYVERELSVGGCDLSVCREERFEVPHNVQFLGFYECEFGGRSLMDDVPSLCRAFELEEFQIYSCEGIEYIFSEDVHPYITTFANLRTLDIRECEDVKKLWPLNIGLPSLEEINVKSCQEMEAVFVTKQGAPTELPRLDTMFVTDLPELRSISDNGVFCPALLTLHISSCKRMKKLGLLLRANQIEELFVEGDREEDVLVQLKILELCDLPELRSVWSVGVSCPMLFKLKVKRCCKVKTLPLLSHTLISLVEIDVHGCNQLEEIILEEEEGLHFWRLKKVNLFDLPKLKSTCLPIHNLCSLTTITVSSCLLIEEIFVVKDETRYEAVLLPCLKELILDNLPELRITFDEDVAFPQLATLKVSRCPKVKKLALRSHNLPSLVELSVRECQHIEEIFGTEDDVDVPAAAIKWPNLKELRLMELPELRSICRKTLVCNSLELVEIDDTNNGKLENFPISIPRLSTYECNREENYPLPEFVAWNVSLLWLSLNWNDLDTKAILRQHGCFTSK